MSNLRILEAWRRLLPTGVAISAGPLLDDAPELTPREEASVGAMGAGRALEFKTGRAYAKLALSTLGLHNVDLPVGADRAPIWPTGVIGSITHTAGPAFGHVAVAVARAATVGGIGIDAEVNRALHPGTWAQFLVDNELQYVRSLPMRSRAGQVLNIWCVKEAATKALREPIDRLEIAVRHEKTLSATQDVWLVAIERDTQTPIEFQAQTVVLPELVLGAVVSLHGETTTAGSG